MIVKDNTTETEIRAVLEEAQTRLVGLPGCAERTELESRIKRCELALRFLEASLDKGGGLNPPENLR